MVVSTGLTSEESCGRNAVVEPVVVELVVAELVEASKRPQGKANEAGDFDRLNHRRVLWAKRGR